jgi:Fur family zinc uptake transcriptional regulator
MMHGPFRSGHRRPRRDPAVLDAAIHDLLAAATRPIGAYELVGALAVSLPPAPSPVQIYRALERLMAARRVRRIESAAGYLAATDRPDAVLHCHVCGQAELVAAAEVHARLEEVAGLHGFCMREAVVEVLGTCAVCAAR